MESNAIATRNGIQQLEQATLKGIVACIKPFTSSGTIYDEYEYETQTVSIHVLIKDVDDQLVINNLAIDPRNSDLLYCQFSGVAKADTLQSKSRIVRVKDGWKVESRINSVQLIYPAPQPILIRVGSVVEMLGCVLPALMQDGVTQRRLWNGKGEPLFKLAKASVINTSNPDTGEVHCDTNLELQLS